MDLEVLSIAANTDNNRNIENRTHVSKLKNSICGDEMQRELILKDEKILDFGYQGKSCVYCQASASLLSKISINNQKEKINDLCDKAELYFNDDVKIIDKKWNSLKKLIKKKNINKKDCILLPFKTLKKIVSSYIMGNLKQSLLAGLFSIITIGILTFLTYRTEFGIFLLASFGSSMVLLYGYPESPFAQPKNVFFGHLVTAIVGLLFLNFVPLQIFLTIPLAVGFGVGLMILLNVTHPPAGGNPIIVIIGSVSFDYLLSPVISGSVIIIIFAIIINKFILKKSYPSQK